MKRYVVKKISVLIRGAGLWQVLWWG